MFWIKNKNAKIEKTTPFKKQKTIIYTFQQSLSKKSTIIKSHPRYRRIIVMLLLKITKLNN